MVLQSKCDQCEFGVKEDPTMRLMQLFPNAVVRLSGKRANRGTGVPLEFHHIRSTWQSDSKIL